MAYLLRFYDIPPFGQLMVRGSQRGDNNGLGLIHYFVFKTQL